MGAGDFLGGLGEGIGSYFGEQAAKEDRERALREMQDTLGEYANLGKAMPSVADQQFQSQGDYRPEMLGRSELGQIKLDPATREAQMMALRRFQGLGDAGGLSAQDKARYQEAQDDVAQAEAGSRGAIMQNMAARGMSGGGAELAAMLANQQGAAQRMNRAGTSIAGEANRRAIDAWSQAAQLGGQIHGQDYGEAAQAAQANDAISRFNNANINAAQLRNLSERQRIADYNKQLLGQQYDRRAALASARSKAHAGIGDYYNKMGDAKVRQYAGVGRSVGGGVGGVVDLSGGLPVPGGK